jgi:hypothetical protein
MNTSRLLCTLAILGCLLLVPTVTTLAAPSGAIFTTVEDGSEVNANIYPDKELVYLDGGPGPGAPATAAGLDDGIYVFQVTDPAGCRQFEVVGGLITEVIVTGCEHNTGIDIDHGATTVQLAPYDDTPNRGGVYKAWAIPLEDFLNGCAAIGEPNGLAVVDCGMGHGNFHGFVPAHTKTDNFKVGPVNNLEIDTWFFDDFTGLTIPGLKIMWIDTLGVSNRKWSYGPSGPNFHYNYKMAHVEAIEKGTHYVLIMDQPGCRVIRIEATTGVRNQDRNGPGLIEVNVRQNDPDWTKEIYVLCDPSE